MTTPTECPNCHFDFETGEVPPVPDWHETIAQRAEALGLPFPSYEHCMTWADQRRVPEGLLEEKALAVANLPTSTWEGHSGSRKPRYHDPWLTLTAWVRSAMNKMPVRTGY